MTSSLFSTDKTQIDSICIGSGRFLRAVLVPALIASNMKPIIVQTRGTSFMNYCKSRCPPGGSFDYLTYEVDTVEFDGKTVTQEIKCYGASSLGTQEGKQGVMNLIQDMNEIKLIGVGVTEAGLANSSTQAVLDLYEILTLIATRILNNQMKCSNPNGKLCVVNTDNVSYNGDTIRKFMMELVAKSGNEDLETFFKDMIVFHNSMVDRITSQREGSNGLVPRAEPTPAKALVIEDLGADLPVELLDENIQKDYGVVVRSQVGQLDADIALKLRVANGTHTAAAHVMALCKLLMTDVLSSPDGEANHENAKLLMKYLDSFFHDQICRGVVVTQSFSATADDAEYVYKDWRARLIHAYFGLSTFFITQNGAAKGGIRIAPTVADLVRSGKQVSCSTIFSLAAILRFFTPAQPGAAKNGVYRGWLDGANRNSVNIDKPTNGNKSATVYADGLSYDLENGWYEFRCGCNIVEDSLFSEEKSLPELLGSFPTTQQPVYYEKIVSAYLMKEDGGDLSSIANHPCTKHAYGTIVKAIASVYARMIAGDGMLDILSGLSLEDSCEVLLDGPRVHDDLRPLKYQKPAISDHSQLLKVSIGDDHAAIRALVYSEVASTTAIDLHTHLLPPTHGALCLYGIDELLTYHYLVAEYFMTAPPSVTPEKFYSLSKQNQADMIWKALFVDGTPISEACRGVVTTLESLGLKEQLQTRDLEGIRKYFRQYHDEGVEGAEKYSSLVYEKAGISYAVMTNIPFDPLEAAHWKPKPKEYSRNYRSALRVDPLLAGDTKTVMNALAASGYDKTIEGAKQYLHDWIDIMKPEYMMASTPHNFVFDGGIEPIAKKMKRGVNEEAMKEPFAFTDMTNNNCDTNCEVTDGLASVIDENHDFLSEVLMKVCEERDLPIALKIGAHRNLNPELRQAGDGVVAFADASVLARLCSKFPKVRFLATFLSRTNQHEACVIANKFSNLHIYGCWWYCNNPSIIEEITKMRVEMLSTAFTAQHSDCRVLDQLLYKWPHSRAVIANVLSKEYIKVIESGWSMTRADLRRDVKNLFGGSYENFMAKSFV